MALVVSLCLLALVGCSFGPVAAPLEKRVTDPYEKPLYRSDTRAIQLFTPHSEMETGVLRIQQGDVLQVRLRGEGLEGEEWGGEFQVPTDGRIDFLYAGTINVAGMTRQDLKQELIDRLTPDYYRNPQISVNFVSLSQLQIRAMGTIGEPKRMSLPRDATIMDALVEAGSLERHSERTKMYLFRSVRGDTAIYFSNYEQYVQGDFRQDLPLRDGDVLYVRTNFWPHFDTLTDVLETLGFAVTSIDAIRDVSTEEQ